MLLALLPAMIPVDARGQVFLAEHPGPEFMIGPLFIRATVNEPPAPATVDVLWSLVVPPGHTATGLEQDLYLLWPGAIQNRPDLGKPDPALATFLEARGFTVVDEGRVPLYAQSLYQMTGEVPTEPLPEGAPYVTVVRQGGPLGLTPPGTYVRVPWTPHFANRTWQMDLRLVPDGLVRPRKTSWIERLFWGPRHTITLTFHDVRQPAVFPLYFEHREHVVRLSDDPSQIILNFVGADHLKIDSISPPSALRQLSQSIENTDTVSVFLDRGEGLAPQTLRVEFGYFRGLQSWTPVLIPMLFFVLGNWVSPLLQRMLKSAGRAVTSRLDLARGDEPIRRQTGVVLDRDRVARLVPGETRYLDVLRLCGRDVEEHERLDGSGKRTLIYRGRRVVPQRERRFGWLATVSRWDVEQHEVEIELDGDVVRDVQARVRRSRLDPGAERN
jgi:hypothetical protein